MKRKLAILLLILLVATAVMPMKTTVLAAENASPTVLPAIREWKGGSGKFIPDSSTVLVYEGGDADEQIELIKGFFADMLDMEVSISASAPSSNYIEFSIGDNQTDNEEGYTLTASETKIEITAETKTGLLYGGVSVVQSVYADGYFPCGTAVDYPAYPVRQGMIDVGRQWTPMESLMNITKYMAWYKLNEIQVHINDCLSQTPYAAFRLESDIPGLTAEDGYYTKDEYREYQREAAKYGITVITEIDTPFHSACFADLGLGEDNPRLFDESDGVASYYIGTCLDIRDEKTIQFVEKLFYEYLGGDDPVFINDTVHVGMDEYPAEFKEYMYTYTERIVRYVNNLGYKARFWSGLGSEGCMYGWDIPDDLNLEIDYWALHLSGAAESVNPGYGVINKMNEYFYVVPGEKDGPLLGFEDYFNYESLEFLYNEVQVNTANIYHRPPNLMEADDPNMLGASFSIWSDYASAYFGITYRDIIDRVKEPCCIIAEKTWNGTDTATKIKFSDFYNRFLKLSDRSGDVDLFEHDLPDGGINLDFENGVPEYVTLNGTIENGALVLDGKSYIAFDEKYNCYGYPNTLSFDITLSELPEEKTELFASANGDCAFFVLPDGTVGYEEVKTTKENYVYTFGYKLEVGKSANLLFSSDRISMILAVNGVDGYNAINADQSKVPAAQLHKHYSTMVIPLAKIGEGIKGTLDNLRVSGDVYDVSELGTGSNDMSKYTALVNYADAYVGTLDDADEKKAEIKLLADTLSNLLSYDNVFMASVESAYDALFNATGGILPNLVSGLKPIISGSGEGAGEYKADLTDGVASANAFPSKPEEWFLFNNNEGFNTVGRVGTVEFDLGAEYSLEMARINLWNNTSWGVGIPDGISVAVSSDGEHFTSLPQGFSVSSEDDSAYWSSLKFSDVHGRYVRISVKGSAGSAFSGLNEIEIYGHVYDDTAASSQAEPAEGQADDASQNGKSNGSALKIALTALAVAVVALSSFLIYKRFRKKSV